MASKDKDWASSSNIIYILIVSNLKLFVVDNNFEKKGYPTPDMPSILKAKSFMDAKALKPFFDGTKQEKRQT